MSLLLFAGLASIVTSSGPEDTESVQTSSGQQSSASTCELDPPVICGNDCYFVNNIV